MVISSREHNIWIWRWNNFKWFYSVVLWHVGKNDFLSTLSIVLIRLIAFQTLERAANTLQIRSSLPFLHLFIAYYKVLLLILRTFSYELIKILKPSAFIRVLLLNTLLTFNVKLATRTGYLRIRLLREGWEILLFCFFPLTTIHYKFNYLFPTEIINFKLFNHFNEVI